MKKLNLILLLLYCSFFALIAWFFILSFDNDSIDNQNKSSERLIIEPINESGLTVRRIKKNSQCVTNNKEEIEIDWIVDDIIIIKKHEDLNKVIRYLYPVGLSIEKVFVLTLNDNNKLMNIINIGEGNERSVSFCLEDVDFPDINTKMLFIHNHPGDSSSNYSKTDFKTAWKQIDFFQKKKNSILVNIVIWSENEGVQGPKDDYIDELSLDDMIDWWKPPVKKIIYHYWWS